MNDSKGKAEAFFSRAGKKIDDLLEEIKKSDISRKFELKERLAELNRNKEKLQNDFENFSKENKQSFNDIADSFEESFKDIKEAFKKSTNRSKQ